MRNIVILLLLPVISFPNLFAADGKLPTREQARQQAPQLRNVVLGDNGVLHGQVINADGMPVKAKRISLLSGKKVYRFSTDDSGQFRLPGLSTGACLIDVGDHSFACRLWSPEQAPPKCIDSIALVTDGEVVRGQNYCPPEKKKRLGRLTMEQRYGIFVLGLFGAAGYIALRRENVASS